jgi:phosphoenolpyruvate-protein phosphotransferase (PTS system enzyme I)
MRLTGLGVSGGRAVGTVHVLRDRPAGPVSPGDDPDPVASLTDAIARCKDDLADVIASTTRRLGAEHAGIFQAHLTVLDDAEWLDPIVERVKSGQPVVPAVLEVSEDIASELAQLADPYLKERAADIRDLAKRLVRALSVPRGGKNGPGLPAEGPIILAAHELTPSDTVDLDPAIVRGLVTEVGARTAHAAILARQLGIPAVVAVDRLMDRVTDGMVFALDGDSGECELEPTDQTAAAFRSAPSSWPVTAERAATRDGVEIAVHANAGSPEDVARAVALGADGIGLYRTELNFIRLGFIPDEEAQYAAYSAAAEAAGGRPIVFRTLDIGGDKPLDGVSSPAEDNPLLGVRGVRLSLRPLNVDGFRAQIRALARTAQRYSDVSVMVPMVSRLEELDAVKAIVAEVAPGIGLRLGAMVEVPAAAVLAAPMAAETDFLSVGTNDLTAYLTATDRTNPHVEYLYSEVHPAMLRTLAAVAQAGAQQGTPMSICGELAGEPRALPLLVGLGYRSISLAPPMIPRLKAQVQALDTRLLATPVAMAMSATRSHQVEQAMRDLQAVSS